MKIIAPLLMSCLLATLASAQSVPSLINYQGRLLDAAGSPLSNQTYKLTFRIYGSAAGTDLIWGPQIFDGSGAQGHGARVPVSDGYFSLLLGPDDTASRTIKDAFGDSVRYLEITVEDNDPMAPRQQMVSAPFAMQAERVNHIDLATTIEDGAIESDDIDGIHADKLNDGFLDVARLPSASDAVIESTHIKDGSVGASDLGMWSVGHSQLQPDVIQSVHIVTGGVESSDIKDGTIDLADLAESLKQYLVPTGTIAPFAGDTAPNGWELCDGQGYWSDHPLNVALFQVVSNRFGSGESGGRPWFKVPDLRGKFLRGQDAGAGWDPDAASRVAFFAGGATGDAVGSYQFDAFRTHSHGLIIEDTEAGDDGGSTHFEIRNRRQGLTDPTGGSETRPINMYVNYIIKF